jgi:choline-sulfatase
MPGWTRSSADAELQLLDLYPTLNELCHLTPRHGLEGHSLVPQLKDANAPRPWLAITTHNRGSHSIRSVRWRYIRYADGTEELYDHRDDPHEWQNVASDSRLSDVKREHSRWLPGHEAKPVPGSAIRFLNRDDGIWYWERQPIVPGKGFKKRVEIKKSGDAAKPGRNENQ